METVEREGRVEVVRLVLGDGVGKAPARGRRRLEAAIAPAAVEIHARQRPGGDDRRAVHRHVADAAPGAQHAHAGKAGKQRQHLAHHLVDDRQVAALGIAVVAVDVAAIDQAALVGLRHVEMAHAEGHDACR